MFREPWVQLHRLVFADELDEWGMYRAANKQREWAKLMVQFTCIYKLHDSRQADIKGNAAARRKRDYSIKVFGLIESKEGKVRQYEFKKDGRIVISPPGLWNEFAPSRRGFRVLSGRFPDRRRRLQFAGTQTGRWSSRSPNLNGTVPRNDGASGGSDSGNIRGTVDAIRDGNLFDFRTVRGTGPRLTDRGREYELVNGHNRLEALRELAERNGEPGYIRPNFLDKNLTAGIEVPIEYTQEQWAQLVEFATQNVVSPKEARLMESVAQVAREVSMIPAKGFTVPHDVLNQDSKGREFLNRVVSEAARKAAEEAEAEFFNAEMGIPHETLGSIDEAKQGGTD